MAVSATFNGLWKVPRPYDDFITIQQELERISVTVETLQLWSEKMLLSGAIDRDAYEARRKQG